ncbi:hypothetical protein [Variovorax paradoxus]|uniref:hypothetical protein n=1 Tax=Variovorax paradoxus TaxID=34073 RepID=UPI003D651BF1
MTESSVVLRRYTDLASLLDMLQRRAITLLSPSSWDDRNDRLMMETYREFGKLKTLLALCLTSTGETYHHWKVFTHASNGVCIQFHRAKFIRTMQEAGVEVKEMSYLKFDQLVADEIPARELPFIKRLAFRHEGEVRALYESTRAENAKTVEFDISIISKITLNPWLPAPVADSVINIIQGLVGHWRGRVMQSQLIESPTWKDFAAKYERPELATRS